MSAAAWWRLEIRCEPALNPAVFARLRSAGLWTCTLEEEANVIRAFLAADETPTSLRARLALRIEADAERAGTAPPATRWDRVDECTTPHEWPPFEVGDRLVVQPASAPVPDGRLSVRLLDRVGFGAGHATTRLALEALDRTLRVGDVVADVGCGTGVLAIAAAMLGAASVVAVDVDPVAVATARANRDFNGIAPERLSIEAGSATALPDGIDLALCNLRPAILDKVLRDVRARRAVVSGFRGDDEPRMKALLRERGWRPEQTTHRDGWCAIDAVAS